MRIITFCFGILCLLCPISGEERELFAVNQEVKFAWSAKIRVGSNFPEETLSEWNINANLIVKKTTDAIMLQLSDIKSEDEFTVDISRLLLPFRAVYKGGTLVSLETTNDDVEWSINIKRALASLLQLDINGIFGSVSAFISSESGLYGTCRVEYIVSPVGNNVHHIRKILDLVSCKNSPSTFWSSSPKLLCPSSYQTEVLPHAERAYFVDKDAPFLIKNITSKAAIVLEPYQSRAEAHTSIVNQTLLVESVGPIAKELSFPGAMNVTDLFYREIVLDATYGLPPSNKTIVLSEISTMLEDLSNSLWWEVGSRGLNNETVFSLINLMWWLELEDWEQLYHKVTLGTSYQQETMQHLFWELVPVVGSPQSVLFIRDLVKSERIRGLLAGRLLVNFPFYQRKPTEDLLTQCEEFLHWSYPIGKDVRHSAILTFANLLHKVCNLGCKSDTIDRYAKFYLDRFTESTEYEERMLYLQGLSNIELKQSLDYLAPIITGQTTTDHHIQFLSTWAVINTVYTYPNKIFELFWPVLCNRSQTLEVRVAALTMLVLSKPAPDRFISLFWYMQTEPSLQLYNFFYTTVKSLASTTYPCYSQLGIISSQLTRYVPKKTTIWATGNYLLDYEDKERGFGGVLQLLSIGSERTGLPNVFIFMTEQHSLGVTTSYALYIKAEGVGEGIKRQLHNMTVHANINFAKIAQLLKTLKAPIKEQEEIHLEFIFKVDGRTIITQYLNSSSFNNITTVVRKLSSVYFEFSVNYQRLMFPLFLTQSLPTDIGTPSLIQIRSGTLVSARGSVSQDDEGRARNAELDLRYSWNGITGLQLYNPLNNKWYGGKRSRSLHIKLPFAVQLQMDVLKEFYKIKTIQHRDYMAGSRLGVVWHAVTNIIPHDPKRESSHPVKEEWTMDSEDLGARLGASVFNCPGKSTIRDALHLLKKAFLTKEKNYQMVPGGVVLLGLFSLKEHLAFQPPGSRCGLMLSFTPLLSQVEPVLTLEKKQLRLQMSRKDGVLWEIQAGFRQISNGKRELTFKLYHTPSVRDTVSNIWRVIQLEGAFVLPSGRANVFNPPAPVSGYTFISWGDSSPTHADKAAVVDVKVVAAHSENQNLTCDDLSPTCLQSVMELATQQVATTQYVNLPGWLITAAHALFPEHVQMESSSTKIDFSFPAALPSWSTKGLCAVNSQSVLTLDNTTSYDLSLTGCFTVMVADCSQDTTFAVLVKKVVNQHLAVKIYVGSDVIELLPTTEETIDVFVNENIKLNPITEDYEHGASNTTKPFFSISVKQGGQVDVELHNGVVVQHYTKTIVALVPGLFRGYTCGLCGNFNSDINNEPIMYYTQC
ncbi:uncharacterized protein LOC128991582 [Macrosteles quadrilineatus]|uniref:uncharacterized protein LOC128991582 n=1 Tax=Macrosteles quadrilineatus TaxID=74068 RepID=UPI0023E11797|nr:uncharacterized protein LOC128991582 [Macrosteles quadrilineatus]